MGRYWSTGSTGLWVYVQVCKSTRQVYETSLRDKPTRQVHKTKSTKSTKSTSPSTPLLLYILRILSLCRRCTLHTGQGSQCKSVQILVWNRPTQQPRSTQSLLWRGRFSVLPRLYSVVKSRLLGTYIRCARQACRRGGMQASKYPGESWLWP
jgi:hypothetical protein